MTGLLQDGIHVISRPYLCSEHYTRSGIEINMGIAACAQMYVRLRLLLDFLTNNNDAMHISINSGDGEGNTYSGQ
jgi:hypothetical protein